MKKRIFIALILILMLVPTFIAQANKPAPSLTVTTEYIFVGHFGEFDVEGRLLAWQGTVEGDIEGVIKWWMVVPFNVTGQVSHYVDRWEIWNLEETDLLLAGEEFGSTTNRPGLNGVWRTNGTVTETSLGFEDWFGRQSHAGGEFIWAVPGEVPSHGWGTFRIN